MQGFRRQINFSNEASPEIELQRISGQRSVQVVEMVTSHHGYIRIQEYKNTVFWFLQNTVWRRTFRQACRNVVFVGRMSRCHCCMSRKDVDRAQFFLHSTLKQEHGQTKVQPSTKHNDGAIPINTMSDDE